MRFIALILLVTNLICSANTTITRTPTNMLHQEMIKILLEENEALRNKLKEPNNNTQPDSLVSAKKIITEKAIAVIIPSYKNAEYCKKNLDSIFAQKYTNFRIIYVDDCSPDGTAEQVEKYVKECGQENKVTLIKNKTRQRALANLYKAIHLCDDHEIVAIVDGDDWLAHDQVLTKLNEEYSNADIWLTYGNYSDSKTNTIGHCADIPQEIIASNRYREYNWVASHLRTFYAWLFKEIKREDLLYKGQFAPMSYDLAIMLPLLEMSGGRFKFIPEALYIYNNQNPINDHLVDRSLQINLDIFLRNKPPYTPLEKAPEHIKN